MLLRCDRDAAASLKVLITFVVLEVEIGLAPRHDTVTFVISDGETETLALCCSGGSPVRTSSTAHLRQTLPVYDLQITVFPVDSQPPTLETRERLTFSHSGEKQNVLC